MNYLISLMLLLLLISCGSGSEDNSLQVIPTTEDLKGTYALTSATGSFLLTGGPLIGLDGHNKNYSGNLYIDENYYVWEMTIDGSKVIHAGRYGIDYTNAPTEGIMTVINSNSSHFIDFQAFYNNLYTENIKFLDEGTYNASEHWTKIYDKPFFSGDPNVDPMSPCSPSVNPGLCVAVVDAQTGEPIACDATVIISNDFYYEEASNSNQGNCYDNSQICGLYGMKGIYNIRVTKPNYVDAVVDDIIITSDHCHVQRVDVQVSLEQSL